MALEHAVIDVAARTVDPFTTFRLLADVCQTRQTTAGRIATTLRERRRVPRRGRLLAMLADLESGACSVLEREYLRAVERRHTLPQGTRQARSTAGGTVAFRDVLYERFGLVVELDGKAFHDTAAARDRDAERDLDAAVDGDLRTVRITYGMVFGRPCRTAERLGRLLQRDGPARPRAARRAGRPSRPAHPSSRRHRASR